MLNEGFRLFESLEDRLDDVNVAAFVVAADIVDFADATLADDEVDGGAVVLDVEPVADVFARAVNRELLVGKRIDNHEWDEFFGKMVGAVVVRAAGNRRRQLVRAVVGHDEEVGRSLRSAVGARRVERGLLGKEKVRSVERQIAVDFVGRNLMVARDAVLAAGVEQDARADDVCLEKNFRVLDGAVDVALGGKVDDDVRVLGLEEVIDGLAVGDVGADECEVFVLLRSFERLEVAGIGELVKADQTVFRVVLEFVVNEVATDKTGAAGNDDGHGLGGSFRLSGVGLFVGAEDSFVGAVRRGSAMGCS